jgi:hypothetical protein
MKNPTLDKLRRNGVIQQRLARTGAWDAPQRYVAPLDRYPHGGFPIFGNEDRGFRVVRNRI